MFRVVVPDCTATIVHTSDPRAPRLVDDVLEYAQARGFHVHPAHPRHLAAESRHSTGEQRDFAFLYLCPCQRLGSSVSRRCLISAIPSRMCCFSGPVEDVTATRIFARMASPGRQILAYEMVFAAASPVAMILPLPTPSNSPEDAVRFISLENYPSFFVDLYEAFTWPDGRPRSAATKFAPAPQLAVHVVGDFVASFIPSLADFARLDPRFRIPPGTVDRVPGYSDYGFVVFQLRATTGRSRVHPMAFEFQTRDAERLYFPLLHVHDGELHAEADFDHVLYAQGLRTHRLFEHGSKPLKHNLRSPHAKLVVDLDASVSRREIVGTLPNRDEWALLV